MSRSPAPAPEALTPAAPALLEADLAAWAGEAIAAGGRRYALLGRVESLRLSDEGRTVEAKVKSHGPYHYRVRVSVNGDGLAGRCTCADETHAVCIHLVATLVALRFPPPTLAQGKAAAARRPAPAGKSSPELDRVVYATAGGDLPVLAREDRVALAWDAEMLERRARARRERASVTRLPGGEHEPPRFEVLARRSRLPEAVTLRGPEGETASCSCEDFARDELATCKHVERVRIWLSRKKKPAWPALVSVCWIPREWPTQVPDPLQELRLDVPEAAVPEALAPWFSENRWLREAPAGTAPSAWAGAALAAAGEHAQATGRPLDVDPVAAAHVARARADEERSRVLSELVPGGEAWDAIVPALGFRLHAYQEEGVAFLARTGRTFLADDMGLGKTVQAIAAALLLRRAAGAAKVLVVCPASLKHQWRREIEKACGEQARVVEGSRAQRLADYAGWREGFLILNYELVLRDVDAVVAAAADVVVLDEAQRIKNWDTKTARAVKRLASPFAFILTGTPLENRLVELHSLVEFLHPRALGPRWRLLPFHAVTDPRGRVLAYEGLDVLRDRLRAFFLRRERRAVLHQLPERTEHTFWTGMTLVQRRPYREHASRIAAMLARGPAMGPQEIRGLLRSLTSMRILCNAFAQYAWDRYEERVLTGPAPRPEDLRTLHSPKLEEFHHVLDDLLEEAGSKVVVFSQWERMLRLAHWAVKGLLDARGERAEVFHGGLDSRSRGRVLEAFRDDPAFRVLFSTDAGGLGLNLQEAASIVVNLEVPWNPAVLEQRIGRVHRIGQRKGVQVLHFVTRGAVEERVLKVVEGKRALFEGLLVEEADRIAFDDEGGRTALVEQVRSLVAE